MRKIDLSEPGRAPEETDLLTGPVRERIRAAAKLILQEFDTYYFWSRYIPDLAKKAFEARDWGTSLVLSQDRLSTYSVSIGKTGPRIAGSFPEIVEDERLWRALERDYLSLIRGRYEADLAFAFIHSVRRKVFQDAWQPVEYSFSEAGAARAGLPGRIHRNFSGGGRITPETIAKILQIPAFSAHFRDRFGDARLVAERINDELAPGGGDTDAVRGIEMIDAGFYRNRGAYLLGRLVMQDGPLVPLAIALLNEGEGIYVDAVLLRSDEIHNIFSSTLANFHVTNPHYHELSSFLFSLMPKRPLGLHYSTIGFNHVGKVAVMNELEAELTGSQELLGTAVGFPGTVAIGFSSPSSSYVLKIIRDEPTASYKWGTFDGVDTVLGRYRIVHEINRTGSMLDNIIYHNVKLDRRLFDPVLLDEILTAAKDSVSLQGDDVVFKHLIVQLKMIPLPVFLETASREEAEAAVINLGYCIKNNTAANVFNKDLDGRNYGVSKILKVYLYDYDAVEVFTDIKIRTNLGRFDGEDDVPEWVFEEGFVFLPEEIEVGLRIHDRSLRRLFREVHGDLLTTAYWERIQQRLNDGKVPRIRTYPDERKLVRHRGAG